MNEVSKEIKGNEANTLLATGLMHIYDRKDIIGIVPLSYVEGLWACHVENLYKYEGKFNAKGIKPLYIVKDLPAASKIFKSKGLNPYGQNLPYCLI